eukprot:PITA_02105
MNSIHLVLSLVASLKWEVQQMDVKYSFLHGYLHEEIYMEQAPRFIQTDSSLVYRLKKSLYGLKQAPKAWYAKMDSFLLDTRFSRCHFDNTVYTKKVVLQSKEGIPLSQSKYACDLLCHFHMEDYKPSPSPFKSRDKLSVTCNSLEVDATLYRQLVEKNLYLTHTRPDLSFVVALISQFMQNPHEIHWKATKRILRYVRGYVFSLSSGPITWACKKQSSISLSSVEAEYCGVVEASKEALLASSDPVRIWLSTATCDYTLV